MFSIVLNRKGSQMIIEKILQIAPSGTRIPKPNAKADFIVKGVGKRRNENALIYQIPNHQNPNKPYSKGVTFTEFEKAFTRLQTSGEFTREWFDANLPECSKEGGCNFTTIGGIFELLNIAKYTGPGRYQQHHPLL
jgi:hypothetical protein